MVQSIRELWSHEKLLNIAEQLLGTADIVGHPVWNLRPKIPRNEVTTVPWHQGRLTGVIIVLAVIGSGINNLRRMCLILKDAL